MRRVPHTRVPLASAGVGEGTWVRIRVVMDLPAGFGTGLGSVDVMNLTNGATSFVPVTGLQGIPLALNPASPDATNPTRWNALFLHFEGAAYSLDNVQVGRASFGRPYGTACNGVHGVAELSTQGTFRAGQTVQLSSTNHAASVPGVILLGASNVTYLGAGNDIRLELAFGPPNAPATLVLGGASVNLPLFTGFLVPRPDVLISGLPLGSTGALTLTFPFPRGVAAGAELWFQYWIPDLAATHGLVASVGLRGVAP